MLVQVHDHILFGLDYAIELMGIEVLDVTLLRINLTIVDHSECILYLTTI